MHEVAQPLRTVVGEPVGIVQALTQAQLGLVREGRERPATLVCVDD